MTYTTPCLFLACLLLTACNAGSNQSESATPEKETARYATLGAIERLDAELDNLMSPEATIEVLANGFEWTEGPVWVSQGSFLLFSDIPRNSVFKWTEEDSISLYLKPAGSSSEAIAGEEPGSNGLLLDRNGKLVLCQHGDRQLARMEAPLAEPKPVYKPIVSKYKGKRLNSPNDAAYLSNAQLYFTDPPYGLPGGADSQQKELDFQGVYRYDEATNTLTLLTKELSRPNGIGFSPDGKTLYVANSDPEKAIWMAYDVTGEGNIENGRVFYDATSQTAREKGLPDGLAVHSGGYLFATGPGGVWIFSPEGKHLGTIKTGEATANCTFGNNESVLYITADMYLLRVRLKPEGKVL